MFSSLLALFSCSSNFEKLPVFPQTNNPEIVVNKLLIPANQSVISYIISKDKKQIFVYGFENENTQPMAGSHLLVFEQNGDLSKDIPLNINANDPLYDLFFTNKGLLTMSNGEYIHFIDTKTFQLKSFLVHSETSNPLSKIFEKQAKEQSMEWRDAEIKKINVAYHLSMDEIKVENKKIPTAYWSEYRAIKSESEKRTYANQQFLYKQYVNSLVPKIQTLNGIIDGNIKYVLLKDAGNEGLFQVANDFEGNINWIFLERNKGIACQNNYAPLTWEKDQVKDADNVLICLDREKTSSVSEDLTGRMTTDYAIQIQLKSKLAKFKTKDRPLKLANDFHYSLANGHAVVNCQNSIYIIK